VANLVGGQGIKITMNCKLTTIMEVNRLRRGASASGRWGISKAGRLYGKGCTIFIKSCLVTPCSHEGGAFSVLNAVERVLVRVRGKPGEREEGAFRRGLGKKSAGGGGLSTSGVRKRGTRVLLEHLAPEKREKA